MMTESYRKLNDQYAVAINEGWFDVAMKVITDATDWIEAAEKGGIVTDGWAGIHRKKWEHRIVFVLDNVLNDDVSDEDLGRGH